MSHNGNHPSSERVSSLARHPARLIQRAFEQSHTGMVITDDRGHIVLANDAFCRITGCDRNEVTGWQVEHFFVSLRIPTAFPLETENLTSDSPVSWQQEVLCRRHHGDSQPVLMIVNTLPGRDGDPHHYLRTFVDLATPDGYYPGTRHWVHVDPMTGIPNWLLLRDRLNHAIAQAERSGQGLALLFIDVDHFKGVNDAVGHLEGDRLLGELARRMQGALRSKDTLARLGGDEFVIILEQNGSAEAAQTVADRLQEALEPPFIAENRKILLTVSIGIALYPTDADDEESLITVARSAMYTARKKGPGRLAFVDHRLTAQLKEKHRLECQLSEAAHLPDRYFVVHYQPELDPDSGRCIGLEASLHWHRPRRGLQPPHAFHDAVNRLGLGVRLDRWTLGQVVADHQRWLSEGSPLGDLPIAVPLSESHLSRNTFDSQPLDHFLRKHLDAAANLEWLTLEISGTGLGKDLDAATHMLKRLEKLGVYLGINNLGSTPVDLTWLSRLPLHRAKFHANLTATSGQDQQSLVHALCLMVEALKIEPGMRGIDDATTANDIGRLPLARVQGDFFCSALATKALESWLSAQSAAKE